MCRKLPPLLTARATPPAVTLLDGTVLVVPDGGQLATTAELLYNP